MLPAARRRLDVLRRRLSAARRAELAAERLENRRLLAVNVTNLDDSGPGSLRAAIEAVNSAGVSDTIVFQNLTGTIATKSALPTLAVTGTSFLSTGVTAVTLDGSLAGAGVNGLTIGNNVNTIGIDGIALTIQNFKQNGIAFLGGSTGTTVRGVTVRVNGLNGIQIAGGDYTGSAVKSNAISDNGKAGIAAAAGVTGLTVGGAGFGNNIYGNDTNGIELAAGAYTSTSITANIVSNNSQAGIATTGGVTGLAIGGTGSGTANSIAVNGGSGLVFAAGDYTGTAVVGNSVILNSGSGVSLAPGAGTLSNLVLGGTAAGSSNAIALNTAGGITAAAGTYTGSAVVGNQIISNKTAGISLDPAAGTLSGLTIGGSAQGQENSIMSNTGPGVRVAAGGYASTTILGNTISSNTSDGITLAAAAGKLTGLVVGGTPNTITANLGDGINVGAGTFTDTRLQNNTITGNSRAGIRLAPSGGSLTDMLVGGTASTLGNRLSGNSSPESPSDAELVVEQGIYTGTRVQGNEFTNAATAILLSGAQSITLGGSTADLGNSVTGSTEWGLRATGALTGSKAVSNTFTDNAVGVRLENASGFALGDATVGNMITGGTTGIVANGVLGSTTVLSNTVSGPKTGMRVIDAQGTSAAQPFTVGVVTSTAGSAGGNRVIGTVHGLHALGNLTNTVIIGNIFRATGVNGNGAALSAATNLALGGSAAGYGNVLTSAQGSALYAKGVCTGSQVYRNNMTASRFGVLLENAQSLAVGSLANAATSNIVQYNQVGLATVGTTTGSGVMHTRWYNNVRTAVNTARTAVYPYV